MNAREYLVKHLKAAGAQLLWCPAAGDTGSTLEDLSGNGRTGALMGAATREDAKAGIAGGQGIDLTGASGWISGAPYTPLGAGVERTFLILAKHESDATDVLFGTIVGTGWAALQVAAGTRNVDLYTNGGSNGSVGTWPDETAHHLMGLSFSDPADTKEMFIDGASLGSSAATRSGASGAGTFSAGAFQGGQHWDGPISLVAVFNGLLTAQQHVDFYEISQGRGLPVSIRVREKPPLRLNYRAIAPSGRRYRWAADEVRAANVAGAERFSDVMPGGFETLELTLPRKPGVDYSDLERLSTIQALDAGGGVAGEYRLEKAPRTSGTEMSISPAAVGWQAHLEDDKSVAEVIVDRDLSHWQQISRKERIDSLAATLTPYDHATEPDPTTGLPALRLGWESHDNGRAPRAIATYDAGPLARVLDVYYDMVGSGNISASFRAFVGVEDSDDLGSGGSNYTADLLGASAAGLFSSATARRFAVLWFDNASAAGWTDWGPVYTHWRRPAVFGNHGLTKRGTAPDQGFYASDVIPYFLARWAPLLRFSTGPGGTIRPSFFVIPQLEFREPTTLAEVLKKTNRFHLRDWAVWEGARPAEPTFYYHQRGERGRRWKARTGPAQLEETGPQVDRLWNGVVVAYRDVDGTTKTVGPPGSGAHLTDSRLLDSDPENPANKLGIRRYQLIDMQIVSTPAAATEVGWRFLEQSKLLETSGRATLTGWVEDDRGVLHPYHRVRSGDEISFVDAANRSYRRIVKSEKTPAEKACAVDLDSPPDGMEALLERLGVVLVTAGVAS